MDRITAVSALGDPVRRRLYDYVVAADAPVGRDEAARGAGVPLHSARFHLDRLVGAGLLEVSYARLGGRSGPGAGRPSKLYRRAGVEVAVSLPPRSYDLVGAVLAAAVERVLDGGELTAALREEAQANGRAVGSSYDARPRLAGSRPDRAGPVDPGDELDRVAGALGGAGFEPHREHDEVALHNCPFDALARDHTQLVCGVNLDFVTGVLDGLGCASARAHLRPEPEHCCVRVSAD